MTAKSITPYFVLLAELGVVVGDGEEVELGSVVVPEPPVLDGLLVAVVRVVASVAVDSVVLVVEASVDSFVEVETDLRELVVVEDSAKTPPPDFVVLMEVEVEEAGLELATEEVSAFPPQSPVVLMLCQVPDMSP